MVVEEEEEEAAALACSLAILRFSLNDSGPGERPSSGDWPGDVPGEREGEVRGGRAEAEVANVTWWCCISLSSSSSWCENELKRGRGT